MPSSSSSLSLSSASSRSVSSSSQIGGLGGEIFWLCPSLDAPNFQTATLTDLAGSNDGLMIGMDPVSDWVVDTERGGQYAIEFDGVSEYIDNNDFTQSDYPYTVSVWMKMAGTGVRIAFGRNIAGMAVINRRPLFYFSPSNFRYATSTLDEDIWYHWVAVVSGDQSNQVENWIDGVNQNASPGNSNNGPDVNFASVSANSATRAWNGRLDDIRVFDRALSESEIQNLSTRRGWVQNESSSSSVSSSSSISSQSSSTLSSSSVSSSSSSSSMSTHSSISSDSSSSGSSQSTQSSSSSVVGFIPNTAKVLTGYAVVKGSLDNRSAKAGSTTSFSAKAVNGRDS